MQACLLHTLDLQVRLQRDGSLRRHRFEQQEIVFGEFAADLVQGLNYANNLTRHGAHRYTENVLGRVAGSLVDVGVEALVCRSVMHDQALTGPEDIARDARIVVDTDFPYSHALGDTRVEFVGLGIV